MYDVAIIGGGPAGLQAAIYTSSEGLKTVIFEGSHLGGQIHDTPKLENFAGQNVAGVSGPDFINSLKLQCEAFQTSFIKEQVNACTQKDRGWFANHYPCHSIILACGYRYNQPDCLGIQDFLNKTAFIGPFKCMGVPKGKTYTVVGGGNSAGQAIMSLAEHAKRVNVLTRSKVGMSQYLVDRILAQKNINIKVDILPNEINRQGLLCNDGREYLCDYTFFCLGGRPSLDFLPKSVKMDEQGHVIVNEKMEIASLPNQGIYSIGDCVSGVKRHSIGTCCGHAANATAWLHTYLRGNK